MTAAPRPNQGVGRGRRSWLPTFASVVLLTAIGLLVRAYAVLSTDFPANDGGLFYRMVLDLERTWPALPEVATYNGLNAPFAYPPLAFYLGSALHGLLGIDAMRLVPLAAAACTVPAFYLLARSVLGPGLHAAAATGAFAIMPRTFEWMTMGGGLTRAPGLLFALLALWLALRTLRDGGWWSAIGAGVVGGLVVLTHPQAALFTALSGLLLAAWMLRERAAAVRIAVAVAIAVVIALPWLLTLVARGDVEALVSAAGTQPGMFIGLLSLLSFEVTGSRLFDVLGLFAAVGVVLSIVRGRWLLPLWLVALMVLDARGGATYAAVPASLLAGTAFVDLLIRPFWEATADAPSAAIRLPRLPLGRALMAILLVAVAIVDGFGSQIAPSWRAVALSPDQRAAMREVEDVAPDGDYLVVSGQFWAWDATAEWFPVLAGARSVATVQGHEWLGRSEFARRLEASEALRACASAGDECLAEWSETWRIGYTHVFIPKGSLQGAYGDQDCCTGLRLLLRASDEYVVIHDGDGATIFERLDG